jgi:hypothetical protein
MEPDEFDGVVDEMLKELFHADGYHVAIAECQSTHRAIRRLTGKGCHR